MKPQPYTYYVLYTVVAEAAGLHLRDVFLEPERIAEAYRRLPELLSPELWAAVGHQFAVPSIQGTSYDHVTALGVEVDFPLDGEPKPRVILHRPEDVETLQDPPSFLQAGLMPGRMELQKRLRAAWGEEVPELPGGFGTEGPVTSAALMAGQDFFMWPYDNPEAAHRLLEFCVRSAHAFQREWFALRGWSFPIKTAWVLDDFAGMFPPALFSEFVVPYWNLWYELAGCERRCVHTELLRPAHLPLLADCKIDFFDPGVDQHVTPAEVRDLCPCEYQLRLAGWEVCGHPVEEVLDRYRYLSAHGPARIEFGLYGLNEEPQFLALLRLAKEMAGEES